MKKHSFTIGFELGMVAGKCMMLGWITQAHADKYQEIVEEAISYVLDNDPNVTSKELKLRTTIALIENMGTIAGRDALPELELQLTNLILEEINEIAEKEGV